MAERNIKRNVEQAIEDFNNIKTAIINKGMTIPNGTPTNQYAEKISKISSVYSGEFTPTTDTQTYTLENLPFQGKRIYIWSSDVTSITISSSDTNKYCVDLNIDSAIPQSMGVFRYWRTDFSTPKAGYTRVAIGGVSFANITENSISLNLEKLTRNQRLTFKSDCVYYYTITA